jgi:hypothetical protein
METRRAHGGAHLQQHDREVGPVARLIITIAGLVCVSTSSGHDVFLELISLQLEMDTAIYSVFQDEFIGLVLSLSMDAILNLPMTLVISPLLPSLTKSNQRVLLTVYISETSGQTNG